jgi:hypothetical protein
LSKGTQLLEVYALEIQMYTETKDNKKLKLLYEKALQIRSAIPHPKIMGARALPLWPCCAGTGQGATAAAHSRPRLPLAALL